MFSVAKLSQSLLVACVALTLGACATGAPKAGPACHVENKKECCDMKDKKDCPPEKCEEKKDCTTKCEEKKEEKK